jgi:diacylglycerol kinase (ATP)
MKDAASKTSGFERLRKSLDEKKAEPILVICGGDGTVMWVVTEMAQSGVDHARVPIAIIPLGTGNDFSQTLGWGKESPDLLSADFEKLKKRVTYWLSAQEESLDIWMVEAEVQEYGKFEKVEDGQNRNLEVQAITRHFCNYFSVGVDGKIGYSFDSHRTSSRIGNLAVYGAMGLLKSFTKTKNIGELAVSFRDSVKTEERESLEASGLNFNKAVFEAGTESLSAIEGN